MLFFVHFLMAALCLGRYTGFLPGWGEWRRPFLAVHGLLTAVASLVAQAAQALDALASAAAAHELS